MICITNIVKIIRHSCKGGARNQDYERMTVVYERRNQDYERMTVVYERRNQDYERAEMPDEHEI